MTITWGNENDGGYEEIIIERKGRRKNEFLHYIVRNMVTEIEYFFPSSYEDLFMIIKILKYPIILFFFFLLFILSGGQVSVNDSQNVRRRESVLSPLNVVRVFECPRYACVCVCVGGWEKHFIKFHLYNFFSSFFPLKTRSNIFLLSRSIT